MYHLKWIAKHCGIYSSVLELSRMLWYVKQIRTVGYQKNRIYRLKSARGVWNIRRPKLKGFGMYEIRKTGTIYPRCVDNYHKVFCDLYNLDRRCK